MLVHAKGDCVMVEALFPTLWRASPGDDFLGATTGAAGVAGVCRGGGRQEEPLKSIILTVGPAIVGRSAGGGGKMGWVPLSLSP